MARSESIKILRHLSSEELKKKIKSLEKDTKVLQRLYFIKYRYEEVSVEEAAKRVGISKPVAYIWQDRWNEEGYDGLKPKFAGGRPSKLSDSQKKQLKGILKERDDWATEEVRELILKKFNIEYAQKQVRRILRYFGMKHAKPYLYDYRKPDDAEDIFKKNSRIE